MTISPGREAERRWRRAAAAGLGVRAVADGDLPLLARIYASTRTAELAAVAWSERQKAEFIDMQFRAQHAHYSQHYADMDWLVLEAGGAPVGRLYLERREREHRIVDITFLPEHRGRGLGTALLVDLLDEAADAGRSVGIHVEKFNPAMRLYRRLGFVRIEDKGVYDLMRWAADDQVEADQVKTAS